MEDFRKRKAFEKVCKHFAWLTFKHLRKVTSEDVRLRHTKRKAQFFFYNKRCFVMFVTADCISFLLKFQLLYI